MVPKYTPLPSEENGTLDVSGEQTWVLPVASIIGVATVASILWVVFSSNDPSDCKYHFVLNRVSNDPLPLQSAWRYNYNSAWIPSSTSEAGALIVRAQNLSSSASGPYDVGPSYLVAAVIHESSDSDSPPFTLDPLTEDHVVLAPRLGEDDEFGVEDPRIVYLPGEDLYAMFYSAVGNSTPEEGGRWSEDLGGYVRSQLSLATREVNGDDVYGTTWTRRGPVLGENVDWSKSGALLVPENGDSPFLFWGDQDIRVARSIDNGLTYEFEDTIIVPRREGMWDDQLVESGPEPLQLPDGNYLFLYNSATKTTDATDKPGWELKYNVGWVILDGKDPTNVLRRADNPLLSPDLDWEACLSGSDYADALTPNVVFVEGWQAMPEPGTNSAEYLIWYQGCDAYTSAATLTVHLL